MKGLDLSAEDKYLVVLSKDDRIVRLVDDQVAIVLQQSQDSQISIQGHFPNPNHFHQVPPSVHLAAAVREFLNDEDWVNKARERVNNKMRPSKAARIDSEIIKDWHDKEISDLVFKYYDIFDKSLKNRGGLQQSLEEMTKLKNFLGDRKFKNFLEIGVCDAGSFWMYSMLFCDEDTKIVGLDIAPQWAANLVNEELRKVRNSSYLVKDCFEYIKEVPDESIDLLHIDADHHYEAVASYFDSYYPKVSKGGIILIHDTAACEGSIKFREEVLEPNYNHTLFTGRWLITGDYNADKDIPSPGISLVIKE